MALDRNIRRSEAAERARQASATEAAAFATTAGTMLLGLLAGAEEAQAREHQHDTPMAPDPAATPLPAEPIDLPNAGAWLHADALHAMTSVAASPDPAAHGADSTAALAQAHGDAEATAHAAVGSIVHAAGASAPVTPLPSSATDAHGPAMPAADASHAPPAADLGGELNQVTNTVTGLIDSSLTAISQTIVSLNHTLQQVTSSLVGDITHTLDSITTGLTHLADPAADTPVSEAFASASPAPDAAAPHHDAITLDASGTIPLAPSAAPLQLGFLGQPSTDGHDHHDGAFSALGVHHF